jgi:hypothetical protein
MLKGEQLFDVVHRALELLSGTNMMELGSQGMDVPGIPYKVSKDYFKSLGFTHTSIDLDGRHESLVEDLTFPLIDFYGKYDIVTNFGTTEHVEDQYVCFENIHYFCKDNGIMVHSVPLPNNWIKHCKYHYPLAFFDELANACGYEVCENISFNMWGGRGKRGLANAVLRKLESDSFITKLQFSKLPMSTGWYETNHNNRF